MTPVEQELANTRKALIEVLLKDAPDVLKNQVIRDLPRMSFKDEADFNGYVETVKSLANEGTAQQSLAPTKEQVQNIFGRAQEKPDQGKKDDGRPKHPHGSIQDQARKIFG